MADLGKVMVTPKGTYSASATYEILDLVAHNGSSYIALKAVKGVTPANDGVNWQIHGQGYPGNAAGIPIKDTQGMVVTAGANSNTQTLIDAIADRVMTKLIATNMIANNLLATDPKMVLGAPMGKQLKDEIDKQSSDLIDKMTLKVTSYTHAYLNGPISVKRMVNSIIIDINTTTAQYLNKSIDHTVATLTGDFAPINSLALVPVNGTGVLSYVKISNTGALTLNLTTALAAGSELCIHVEFIAK